ELTRHLLRRVHTVREAEALRAPAGKQPGRGVVRVVGGIVGADPDQLHAATLVLAGERGQPILPGLHVRTVVADEPHRQRLRAAWVGPRDGRSVARRQAKAGARGAERDVAVLGERHDDSGSPGGVERQAGFAGCESWYGVSVDRREWPVRIYRNGEQPPDGECVRGSSADRNIASTCASWRRWARDGGLLA